MGAGTFIGAVFTLLGLLASPGSVAQELVFGVNEGVTYRVTPMETRERYRDLGELLSKTLRRPVRIEPVDDYVKLRKALEDQRYDLAYIHPAHHALRAVRDQKYQVIAVTRGWTEYKARFLMKKDAAFKQPQELRGKKMVMPDPDSITAWMVRATLRDLGMDPAKESLGTTRYQDGIPFMMENGFYEIGITAAGGVVKGWTDKGGKILFESRPVPIKHLIASPSLSKGDVEKIQDEFLFLDKSDAGRRILAKIGFRGFDLPDQKLLADLAKWLGI